MVGILAVGGYTYVRKGDAKEISVDSCQHRIAAGINYIRLCEQKTLL